MSDTKMNRGCFLLFKTVLLFEIDQVFVEIHMFEWTTISCFYMILYRMGTQKSRKSVKSCS